ncbi:MAG TPA: rhomboid family intramembrane serine protease [Thermoanaerobaculaceae bacterium]|nr:rhomboid family intramembrane serine protease [Thermoanaerobaculaceae bacterium]
MSVIPLGDVSRRPVRAPVVTMLIILANVVVFACELVGGEAFVTRWSLIPAQIVTGHRLTTILTGVFLHGGWSHIIGNMVFLWAFGPEIEDTMGRVRYLLFYLLGGVVASLVQVAANAHSTVPNLGASGAIAAVMGAFVVMFPRDRIKTLLFFLVFVRVRFVPAALLIGLWFVTQLVSVGAVANVETGGVAYAAHIGGFVFGALAARAFARARRDAHRSWVM